MATSESIAEGSTNGRGSAEGRLSDETIVEKLEAEPLPKKQGELGWKPLDESTALEPTSSDAESLPSRHPADHAPTPVPGSSPTEPNTLPSTHANVSSTTLHSQSSGFKQFLRSPRPLPKIRGIRASIVFRVVLVVATLISSIAGWVVTVTRMNAWNNSNSYAPPPSEEPDLNAPAPTQYSQMAGSSLVFVHVAFGAAVLFQLMVLERSVYRLRAERYAFLHPEEMASATAPGGSVMSLAPWNRPSLPTYAAALGVRGTGDVEDNIIAVPPPPQYGNTRGSTLLLSAHLPSHLTRPPSQTSRHSRPASSRTLRDVLGRPTDAWSRPVSYGEDELRQNARRSLDLEAALSRLEGMSESGSGSGAVTRPENALVRK